MASYSTRGGPPQQRTGGVWSRSGPIGGRVFTVIPAFLRAQKKLRNPIRNGRNRAQRRTKSTKTERAVSEATKNTIRRTNPEVECTKPKVLEIVFLAAFLVIFYGSWSCVLPVVFNLF